MQDATVGRRLEVLFKVSGGHMIFLSEDLIGGPAVVELLRRALAWLTGAGSQIVP